MIGQAQISAIRAKAEALLGQSLGDSGDTLTAMTAEAAMAWCQREDIPEAMEQAVAGLVVSTVQGQSTVKSLTRGDTSVTYDTGADGLTGTAALSPWRRLGRVKEG